MAKKLKFPVTGDDKADLLLEEKPLALLIGMLLDQQVPMEWAFKGPLTIKERTKTMDAKKIAAFDEDEFVSLCSQKPAIHRFPASMAKRIQATCEIVANEYSNKAENIWKNETEAKAVLKNLEAIPGYGKEKAKIFLAILVHRFGYKYAGFEKAAAPYSGKEPCSVAHVSDAQSLAKVRAFKKAQKAKKKAALNV